MAARGGPDSKYVEIMFDQAGGTWTDVTDDVDWSQGVSTKYGRGTKYGTVQPATGSLVLRNTDGRFAPERQVLNDGVTAHPFYGLVVAGVPIRWGWLVGATRYQRFYGYVTSWPTAYDNGNFRAVVKIDATDRVSRVDRAPLLSAIRQVMLDPGPLLYWPLTDDSTATTGAEVIGTGRQQAAWGLRIASSGAGGGTLAFGDNGPGFGDGTGVKFAPATVSNGRFLSLGNLAQVTSLCSIELSFLMTAAPASGVALFSIDSASGMQSRVTVTTAGYVEFNNSGGPNGGTLSSGVSLTDGTWHHIAVRCAQGGASGTVAFLFVDGTQVGTGLEIGANDFGPSTVRVGQNALSTFGSAIPTANIGQVAVYAKSAGGILGLTTTSIPAHAAANRGYVGELVDARVKRMLGYAAVPATDVVVSAASTTPLGTYGQAGQTAWAAAQDAVTAEAGGASLFVNPSNQFAFTDRLYRDNAGAAVAMTFDAVADLDGGSWSPTYDADTVRNMSTGSRAGVSGTLATYTAQDAASVTQFGPRSDDFTSNAQFGDDVLYAAQERVATEARPRFAVGQVTVDLFTAQNDLYATVGAQGNQLGNRVRVTNLHPTAAPKAQIDGYVEGWADVLSDSACRVTFDLSPAPWINDSRDLWQPDRCFLNAAITRTGTSLVVRTDNDPAGGVGTPFTTDPTAYPLVIQVAEERIRLNTAPTGGTSPQTFNGVTRGVDGTTAAAQSSNAPVTFATQGVWLI